MKIVYCAPSAQIRAMCRMMVPQLAQKLSSKVAGSRQLIRKLCQEPRNLTADDANSAAIHLSRVLGLAFRGPAAANTRHFKNALREACLSAPDEGIAMADLPERVNYDSLREAGVSDIEITMLHKRLVRVCSRHKRLYGRWLEERALRADARRRDRQPGLSATKIFKGGLCALKLIVAACLLWLGLPLIVSLATL